MSEKIDTVIIGGGQAGLSLSYYLSQHGREHVVLEKASQPGEAWRNHRWDSFTLVTPNWSFRLPGAEYQGPEPGGYLPRAEVVRRLEEYIDRYHLPVRYSMEATSVAPQESGKGYQIQTNDGSYQANHVVIATGLFQKGRIPSLAVEIPSWVLQLESGDYRNPQALPPGAVLVVGSGQSGCQIAEELYQSGRRVYLCTGTSGRFPRRYRGKDSVDWAYQSGFFARTPEQLPSPRARFAANPHVSGKNGGHDLNLHQFYRDGVILLGHLRGVQDGKLLLAPDLKDNLAWADKVASDMAKMFNLFIEKSGINAPLEEIPALNDGYAAPEILTLDLKAAGITAILWAVGYSFDFSLVKLPVFDDFGFPVTQRGVTQYPGLYFLGMPWLHTMKSGLFMGVGEDAAYLAAQITSILG